MGIFRRTAVVSHRWSYGAVLLRHHSEITFANVVVRHCQEHDELQVYFGGFTTEGVDGWSSYEAATYGGCPKPPRKFLVAVAHSGVWYDVPVTSGLDLSSYLAIPSKGKYEPEVVA